MSVISIPAGAIESRKAVVQMNKPTGFQYQQVRLRALLTPAKTPEKAISIPAGAIESVIDALQNGLSFKFQYQQVRLRVPRAIMFHANMLDFNTSRCD